MKRGAYIAAFSAALAAGVMGGACARDWAAGLACYSITLSMCLLAIKRKADES